MARYWCLRRSRYSDAASAANATIAPAVPPMKSLIQLVILGWFFCVALGRANYPVQELMLFPGYFPPFFLLGWPERGNHLFARQGRIQGAAPKTAHSHTRPLPGSGTTRAYQPREIRTHWNLGLFILSHTSRTHLSRMNIAA